MRTQMFASMSGIRGAEISDPHRTFAGLLNGGERDIVCVHFGSGGSPNFSTIRAYTLVGRPLHWDNGGMVHQYGRVLTEAWACGEHPNFKPFPEADYQPQPRTPTPSRQTDATEDRLPSCRLAEPAVLPSWKVDSYRCWCIFMAEGGPSRRSRPTGRIDAMGVLRTCRRLA